MALGNEGTKARYLRLGCQNRLLMNVASLPSLNHKNSLKLMGLEPPPTGTEKPNPPYEKILPLPKPTPYRRKVAAQNALRPQLTYR